jgi:hypothetical protein
MNMAKLILGILLALILLVGGYFLFGNYSDGFRAGTMIKFSKRGTVFKTYEGQLNLGMVLNSSPSDDPDAARAPQTSVNSVWEFSVNDDDQEVVNTLEEALLTGKRVKVHYREKFYRLPFQGDTKYFVYKAEMLK